MPISSSRRVHLSRWFLFPLVGICFALTVWLGRDVYRDLTTLRSNDMDTIQWTLSQVEIEYLDFLLAIEIASYSDAPDLEGLRREFDILFSRVDIVSVGALFASLRSEPNVDAALKDLSGFLDRSVPVIDGDDAELVAALSQMLQEAETLRPQARALFVQGLAYFAQQSDAQRARIAVTLSYLGGLALIMLAGLGGMTLYSRAANLRIRERETALARANTHMKTILDTALDAVIVSDNQGRVLDLNAAAERTFGYALSDVKGQSIGDLIVPPELRAAHRAGLKRMMDTGERKLVGKGRVQLEACTADGNRIPVELALHSAQSDTGEVIIAFLRDISQQLENEEELRVARDKALDGERAKADFLAVMSHEIRTPLNGLLGNLTLLEGSDLDLDQAQFVQNMNISGRQLMKHVDTVLDIAKFEAGKLEASPAAFHLGHLIQEIVDAQSGHAERHQNVIEWSWVGPRRNWVESDREHLEQVLLNLVGNAIKFTHSGRISIELEQAHHGPEVEIRVIDSGIGIAEEDLPKVFDDFFTDTAGWGRSAGGTGLGLGIAKRLTHLLGGEIGVESTMGDGSVFWLRLPLPETVEPRSTEQAKHTRPDHATLRVLLVEDNEINAFVAQRLLEREGHQVDVAPDGVTAIHRAAQSQFDVILMDINMPGMDGIQATAEIRALPGRYGTVPILAFSANVLPADTERFRDAGMDGFLGKPLELSELRQALHAVSNRSFSAATHPTLPAMAGHVQTLVDPEVSSRLLRKFRAEGDSLIDLAARAIEEPMVRSEVAQVCHKISSSAALFGAEAFHRALLELEQAAKCSDGPGYSKACMDARLSWSQLRPLLTTEGSGGAKQFTSPIHPE